MEALLATFGLFYLIVAIIFVILWVLIPFYIAGIHTESKRQTAELRKQTKALEDSAKYAKGIYFLMKDAQTKETIQS